MGYFEQEYLWEKTDGSIQSERRNRHKIIRTRNDAADWCKSIFRNQRLFTRCCRKGPVFETSEYYAGSKSLGIRIRIRIFGFLTANAHGKEQAIHEVGQKHVYNHDEARNIIIHLKGFEVGNNIVDLENNGEDKKNEENDC
jgi:hypothetical protein